MIVAKFYSKYVEKKKRLSKIKQEKKAAWFVCFNFRQLVNLKIAYYYLAFMTKTTLAEQEKPTVVSN